MKQIRKPKHERKTVCDFDTSTRKIHLHATRPLSTGTFPFPSAGPLMGRTHLSARLGIARQTASLHCNWSSGSMYDPLEEDVQEQKAERLLECENVPKE